MATIDGDSMIKDVYGLELSDKEEKKVLNHFSGSATEDMKTSISLKCDPNLVIIHVDTNDLIPSHDPKTIAKNIIYTVKNSAKNENQVKTS